MTVHQDDIRWELRGSAADLAKKLREIRGQTDYNDDKRALQGFLCAYFSSGKGDCSTSSGTIDPIRGGAAGWKRLKVRWLWPGSGKSGGLRLAITVHCELRRVVVAGAWVRRDDPSAADFDSAFDAGEF